MRSQTAFKLSMTPETWVTQAAMNGAGELAIMKQTGHRSLATVRRYIRDGMLFRDNAATKLGL
jgi:hypothetical protein